MAAIHESKSKGNAWMRRVLTPFLSTLSIASALSTPVWAKKPAADYPLRVNIFRYTPHRTYFQGSSEIESGDGWANLYEGDKPHVFEFSYTCSPEFSVNSSSGGQRWHSEPPASCLQNLTVSRGNETYMARWKKHMVLEILVPKRGDKTGTMEPAELDVTAVKDTSAQR